MTKFICYDCYLNPLVIVVNFRWTKQINVVTEDAQSLVIEAGDSAKVKISSGSR